MNRILAFSISLLLGNSLSAALSLIDSIDAELGKHYAQHNMGDYFDSANKGKFKNFCEENEFDSEAVKEELELAKEEINDFQLCEFDENFPLENNSKNTKDKRKKIFEIIQTASASFNNKNVKPQVDDEKENDIFQNDENEKVMKTKFKIAPSLGSGAKLIGTHLLSKHTSLYYYKDESSINIFKVNMETGQTKKLREVFTNTTSIDTLEHLDVANSLLYQLQPTKESTQKMLNITNLTESYSMFATFDLPRESLKIKRFWTCHEEKNHQKHTLFLLVDEHCKMSICKLDILLNSNTPAKLSSLHLLSKPEHPIENHIRIHSTQSQFHILYPSVHAFNYARGARIYECFKIKDFSNCRKFLQFSGVRFLDGYWGPIAPNKILCQLYDNPSFYIVDLDKKHYHALFLNYSVNIYPNNLYQVAFKSIKVLNAIQEGNTFRLLFHPYNLNISKKCVKSIYKDKKPFDDEYGYLVINLSNLPSYKIIEAHFNDDKIQKKYWIIHPRKSLDCLEDLKSLESKEKIKSTDINFLAL